MEKRPKIERCCNKCGEKQKPDLKKSNKNWTCYGNEKCKCGGKFEFTFPKQKMNLSSI